MKRMRILCVFVALLVVISSASASSFPCYVYNGQQRVDLKSIPQATLSADVYYKTGQMPAVDVGTFNWTLNLCEPVPVPQGAKPCGRPGFITQYDKYGNCLNSWGNQTYPWDIQNNPLVISTAFTNEKGSTLNIQLQCGATDHIEVIGIGAGADQYKMVFDYSITISSYLICQQSIPPPGPPINCTVASDVGLLDFSKVPTSIMQIDTNNNGNRTAYNWTLNLCRAVANAPPRTQPCMFSQRWQYNQPQQSMLSSYTWASGCAEQFFNQGPWQWDYKMNAATSTLLRGPSKQNADVSHMATIYVGCGETLELKPVGDAIVTTPDWQHVYTTFKFTSSAACSAPPPPPPTPQPTVACSIPGPNGGLIDLSRVPAAMLEMTLKTKGEGLAYNWTFDLCQLTTKSPVGVAPCSTAGFISEFNRTSCLKTWTEQTWQWTWDSHTSSATAQFFSPGSQYNAIVDVQCGPTLKLQTRDQYANVIGNTIQFNLMTSAACPAEVRF